MGLGRRETCEKIKYENKKNRNYGTKDVRISECGCLAMLSIHFRISRISSG